MFGAHLVWAKLLAKFLDFVPAQSVHRPYIFAAHQRRRPLVPLCNAEQSRTLKCDRPRHKASLQQQRQAVTARK